MTFERITVPKVDSHFEDREAGRRVDYALNHMAQRINSFKPATAGTSDDTDAVGGTPSGEVVQGSRDLFFYTFENDIEDYWNKRSGAATITYPSNGTVGGRALRADGDTAWWAYPANIPYDDSRLYRIKVRVRLVTAPADPAKDLAYCGVEGVAADGTTLVNSSGADSSGSQHYVGISAEDMGAYTLGEWQTFTAYFSGHAATGSTSPSTDPQNPANLHDDVRYIRPLFILNYNGGDGVMEIDFISLEVLTVSGEVDALQTDNAPQEAGANVTETRTSNDTSNVDGKASSEIKAAAINVETLVADSLSAVQANMGTLDAGKILAGQIEINADTQRILFGGVTDPTGDDTSGIFLGLSNGIHQMRLGEDPAAGGSTDWMHWDGSTLKISGTTLNVSDSLDLSGTLNVDGATTLAGVTASGPVTMQSTLDVTASVEDVITVQASSTANRFLKGRVDNWDAGDGMAFRGSGTPTNEKNILVWWDDSLGTETILMQWASDQTVTIPGAVTMQSTLDVTGDLTVHERNIKVRVDFASGSGGWARGLMIEKDGANIGGVGFLGSGDTTTHLFLGTGPGPWSAYALKVNPGSRDVIFGGTIGETGNRVTDIYGIDLDLSGILRLQGAEGTEYQLRPSANEATGVGIRPVKNPASNSVLFAVESSGGATRFYVQHSGKTHVTDNLEVGGTVGTTGNRVSTIYGVAGDFSGNVSAAGDVISNTSDRRLKDVLAPVEPHDAMTAIRAWGPVRYQWNERARELGGKPGVRLGLFAQDVQTWVPEAIRESPFGEDYMAFQWDQVMPVMVAGLQGVDDRVTKLERENARLRARVAELEE